jgi:hypothetical protein
MTDHVSILEVAMISRVEVSLADYGKALRVWCDYPVDGFDEAIARQGQLLGVAT